MLKLYSCLQHTTTHCRRSGALLQRTARLVPEALQQSSATIACVSPESPLYQKICATTSSCLWESVHSSGVRQPCYRLIERCTMAYTRQVGIPPASSIVYRSSAIAEIQYTPSSLPCLVH